MGNLIDKSLAILETFFEENGDEDDVDERALPKLSKKALVEYEVK